MPIDRFLLVRQAPLYFWIGIFISIPPAFTLLSAVVLVTCTRSKKAFRIGVWKRYNDFYRMKRRDGTYQTGRLVESTVSVLRNLDFEND